MPIPGVNPFGSTQPTRPIASRRSLWLACSLIVLAGLAAYHNSFSLPFIFDDVPGIVENPTIRELRAIGRVLTASVPKGPAVRGRPIVNLSLALNYALGGLDVRGYHVLNLAIHLLAGLTLFGIVRRTLAMSALPGKTGRRGPPPPQLPGTPATGVAVRSDATILALTIALLWTVHPLQTETVVATIQRTESLMGLFYLLTLYCFIRGAANEESARADAAVLPPSPDSQQKLFRRGWAPAFASRAVSSQSRWLAVSIVCCALGMASKEVMVSAPLIVFLYDRTFFSGSFREAWRRRAGFYCALACTWALLALLVVTSGGQRGGTVGFGLGISAWHYLLTQCRAIVLYLRLSLWPHPLIGDYGTAFVRHPAEVLPQILLLALLAAGTLLLIWHRPKAGFLGAWFFVILAPSSSILPLVSQTVAEHRMYLPLASVVISLVIGGYLLARRAHVVACLTLAIALGWLTIQRNTVYRSAWTFWDDTALKQPNNDRAHLNLGSLASGQNRIPEAIAEYQTALRINPAFADAHFAMGVALAGIPGRLPDAIAEYEAALRISPGFAQAHCNLGVALMGIPGRLPQAIEAFSVALQLDPDDPKTHNDLGNALTQVPGRLPEAIAQFEAAVRIKPDYPEAHYNLGIALARIPGRLSDAIAEYEAALTIKPDYLQAHYNLGNALVQIPGRVPEAIAQFEAALRVNPDDAPAHNNLGTALMRISGRRPEAIAQFETALRIKADYPDAHFNLGVALATIPGRRSEAIAHLEAALQMRPDWTQARQKLDQLQSLP